MPLCEKGHCWIKPTGGHTSPDWMCGCDCHKGVNKMEINRAEFRIRAQDILEDLGMDRDEASCFAEKFANDLKVENSHKQISPNVFNSIFGNWNQLNRGYK